MTDPIFWIVCLVLLALLAFVLFALRSSAPPPEADKPPPQQQQQQQQQAAPPPAAAAPFGAPAPLPAEPEAASPDDGDGRPSKTVKWFNHGFGMPFDEDAGDPFEMALPESEDYWVQRIFFGTDRNVTAITGTGPGFGTDRAGHLTVGATDITIPKEAHRLGHMERPREFTLFKITLWREDEDPAKHFTIHRTEILEPDDFTALAAEAAHAARNYDDTAFLYIHGFNTTFQTAMYRAAQLAHDLGFDGPAFAYSWPSTGGVASYVADMDAARGAVTHLDAFLDLVLTTPGIDKLHVVAHSMGNAALAELVTRAGTKLSARTDKVIDQLILAAPDVDAEVFKGIAQHFTRHAKGVTLYACASDLALMASETIRGGHPRAGDVPATGPVVVPDIDTIDVTAVGTELFSLNHNTYAHDRGLLDDLGNLFLSGLRPPRRRMPTLKERSSAAGIWWEMPG
ncbi:alpha/beta hydrolase [Aestuariicoccus sp. MJ-SS9]|uniref:alpha/beta hydrolase n=1 Tax=Aestuariicoccus sp. MJ-SS9 TaxID=3079855 RepID=UPI002914B402|nr:alpha/beta hydrolase [Aestuariicoccus sp. MJ-SS9]MDU8909892.1 alpha/beta hydrolase [Aestuariicoccus sp. MJ-SS9]